MISVAMLPGSNRNSPVRKRLPVDPYLAGFMGMSHGGKCHYTRLFR